jgi:hypothetical protein
LFMIAVPLSAAARSRHRIVSVMDVNKFTPNHHHRSHNFFPTNPHAISGMYTTVHLAILQ